jgi:transcriptional regulator GlxA family with amidase domain
MIDVTIFYCAGGHVSTSIAPLEVFHAAGWLWNMCVDQPPQPRFRITTVSPDGEPVACGAGVIVVPDKAISAVKRTDLVFVSSAGMDLDTVLARNGASIAWLRRLQQRGALVASACTGVGILAAAGLLDGRKATTHWAFADEYRRRFPKVDWQPQLRITDDGGVLCGAGVYASIDLALYIVEKMCDREIATQCAKALILQMPRTFQTSFAVLPNGRDHGDAVIRRAEDWLHDRYADSIDLDGLARVLAVTRRTFLRRFKAATGETPLTYLQLVRVAAAKRMLEEDRMTVQEVSIAVGYEDVAFFRDLFKRHAGLSPSVYRERFGRGRYGEGRSFAA